jgi:hypothetical protein
MAGRPPSKIHKSKRIEIRLHPEVKAALDKYCFDHKQNISEFVTQLIRDKIGFSNIRTDNSIMSKALEDSSTI